MAVVEISDPNFLAGSKKGYVPNTYFSLEKSFKLALKLQRFQNFKFLKKKVTQTKKSKNVPGSVEISADLKILEIAKLGPRKSYKT